MPDQVDNIYGGLMNNPDFRPQAGKTKEESAWAVAWSRYKQASNNQRALTFAIEKEDLEASVEAPVTDKDIPEELLDEDEVEIQAKKAHGSAPPGGTMTPLGDSAGSSRKDDIPEKDKNEFTQDGKKLEKDYGGPLLNETPLPKKIGGPTLLDDEVKENVKDKLHEDGAEDKTHQLKEWIEHALPTGAPKQGVGDQRHLSPQERGLKYDPTSKRWKRPDEDFSRAGRALARRKATPKVETQERVRGGKVPKKLEDIPADKINNGQRKKKPAKKAALQKWLELNS